MPNPLSRIKPEAHFHIAPGAICERPQLALQAISLISGWAAAEYQVGSLLATVVGEGASQVIMEAINKRNSFKQREMLAEHAQQNLDEEELDLVSAFVLMAGVTQKERNPLVHWLSGYSTDVPDGVLYLNPTHQWRFDAALQDWLIRKEGQPPTFDRQHISVYVQRDYDHIGRQIGELTQAAELIKLLLNWGLPGPGRVYARLRALPLFAAALTSSREDHRRAQEVPR